MSGKRNSDSFPGSKFEATPMNRGIPKRSDAKLISAAFARNVFRSCRPRTGANHPRQRRLRQAHDRRKKNNAMDSQLWMKILIQKTRLPCSFCFFSYFLPFLFCLTLSRSFCLSLSLFLVPPFTLPHFFSPNVTRSFLPSSLAVPSAGTN